MLPYAYIHSKLLSAYSVYADNFLSAYSVQSKFFLQTINLYPVILYPTQTNFHP